MVDEKTKELIFSLSEKIRRELDKEFNFLCALYGVNFDKSAFDLKVLRKNPLKFYSGKVANCIEIPLIPTRENVLKIKFKNLKAFNDAYSKKRLIIVEKYFLRFLKLQKINPYFLLRGNRIYPYYTIMHHGIEVGMPENLYIIYGFLKRYCDLVCKDENLFKYTLRNIFEKYGYGRY